MKAVTRLWKDRSIGIKLGALTVVAGAGLAIAGGSGITGLGKVDTQVELMQSTSGFAQVWSAGQKAADGMRGDLLLGLLAHGSNGSEGFESVIGGLDTNRATLAIAQAAAQGALESDLPGDSRAHLEGSVAAIDTYNLAINGVVNAIRNNPNQIEAAYDTFNKAYIAVDEAMSPSNADIVVSMAEATAAADDARASARNIILIASALALLILIGVAYAVRRAVVLPLRVVSDALNAMARGDLTVPAVVDSKDEVGKMAAAVAEAQSGVREAIAAVALSASQVNESSQHLSQATTQISVAAEQVTAQAGAVAAASGQISGGLQTVAAGSEEMGASIGEIARNATSAANVAAEAVDVAAETNKAMTELSESSVEIGKVVGVITSIAEQTNMLALNATIEAARAGEAGKGFAVVAGEVKDLAQETATATAEITNKVGQIQTKAEEAVAAIGRIGDIIDRINDYQGTIASAVEEQTATTSEINKNMSQAAAGSAEIATNVDGVASAARLTSENVVAVQSSADELAQLSNELRGLVGRFTV